ncbi:hypothetical protein L6164_026092 [Bauhinia variegata]|uniref:Uncharacterized protein n=1 Tax=Bauhinia variegata TaxID=167791 RepID=A0ACB9M6I7_BAUVA|nr:hypothetical protein L6164_026092 [Bauhinia variegata]
MENNKLAKVGCAFGEQSSETNPSKSNSFQLFNPVKLSLDVDSLPQVWQEPFHFSHSSTQNAMASSSEANSYHQFAIDHIPSVQDVTHQIHNPIPQPPRKSPINVAGATSAGLHSNFNPDMDPKKLRQIISNRESANRSRLRRIKLMTDLECKAKKLQDQITSLHPQIEIYTNQKNFLIQEQSSLKQEMANCEKESKLKEAELEKNKAEVHKLRELHRKQQEEFQALAGMLTRDYQQLMFNSNPNYSGGEPTGYTNPNQGKNK